MTVVLRFGIFGRPRTRDASGFPLFIDSMGSVMNVMIGNIGTCDLVKVVPDNSLMVKVCLAITRNEIITGYYTESEASGFFGLVGITYCTLRICGGYP